MQFEFATATQIVFGAGRRQELAAIAAGFGTRALVVTGKDPQRHRDLFLPLKAAGLQLVTYGVQAEPTTTDARLATELARTHDVDFVLGLGGGSALDLGKAVAALVPNPGDPLDYLEVVGKGWKLERPPLPYIAVPTTSGTGAEVTKNAVLDAREHGVKVSLRSDRMLPDVALIDPELTLTVPPEVTASTGFDALAQVIEPFVSCLSNPLTDGLCREGIRRGARSLLGAFRDGLDLSARTDMALTSLFGGLALANAKLGAVHGFAGPLGGMYHAPHGAVCAALLPAALRVNAEALARRATGATTLARFDELGVLLTGRPDAGALDAVQWCAQTGQDLAIPSLSAYGVKQADFNDIIAKAKRASSMKGNPLVLDDAELRTILELAL